MIGIMRRMFGSDGRSSNPQETASHAGRVTELSPQERAEIRTAAFKGFRKTFLPRAGRPD